MIVIDINRPTDCFDCPIDCKKRPIDCPIKCDIEDIKAEIADYKDDKVIHAECNEMVDIVLGIIDKHCGKENDA